MNFMFCEYQRRPEYTRNHADQVQGDTVSAPTEGGLYAVQASRPGVARKPTSNQVLSHDELGREKDVARTEIW